MKTMPYEIGRVVISKQGHDRGRAFTIVGIVDENSVLIADGETRKIIKPKKKKTMHLRCKPMVLAQLEGRLANTDGTLDSYIRKSLSEWKQTNADQEEVCAFVQE